MTDPVSTPILITGATGSVGFYIAHTMLDDRFRVVGVDNLNSYYDVELKKARLAKLRDKSGFTFQRLDFRVHAPCEERLPEFVHWFDAHESQNT